jgi:mRNA interferase MazF
MNSYIATVIVAPMTTCGRDYPTRVNCHFEGKDGQIVLDQIRTVDKAVIPKMRSENPARTTGTN